MRLLPIKKNEKLISYYLLAGANLSAQVAKSRYTKVDEDKGSKFMKLQKQNSEIQSICRKRHTTRSILKPTRAGQLFRARIEQDMAGFDEDVAL